MTQNTMEKPKAAKRECMSAVAYFQAKLDCEMAPAALKRMMDESGVEKVCVIDVRSAEEYKKSCLQLAVNIPLKELPMKMPLLPKNKMIVAYTGDACCAMAAEACLELSQCEFKAMELMGGLAAWKEKGFALEAKP